MTDSMERAERIRAEQRQEWTVSATSWERPPGFGTAADDPVTAALLTLAGIGAGQRVLDLACGNGNPALAIAGRVGAARSQSAFRRGQFGPPGADVGRDAAEHLGSRWVCRRGGGGL